MSQLTKRNSTMENISALMTNQEFRHVFDKYFTDRDNVQTILAMCMLYKKLEEEKIEADHEEIMDFIQTVFQSSQLSSMFHRSFNNWLNGKDEKPYDSFGNNPGDLSAYKKYLENDIKLLEY